MERIARMATESLLLPNAPAPGSARVAPAVVGTHRYSTGVQGCSEYTGLLSRIPESSELKRACESVGFSSGVGPDKCVSNRHNIGPDLSYTWHDSSPYLSPSPWNLSFPDQDSTTSDSRPS